jgi:hypothetical protein
MQYVYNRSNFSLTVVEREVLELAHMLNLASMRMAGEGPCRADLKISISA